MYNVSIIYTLKEILISKLKMSNKKRMILGEIREIMTKDVEVCTLLDNVFEVALKMKEYKVGAIPIVDGDNLVGMITDRDIVLRGVLKKSRLHQRLRTS